MYSAVSTQSTWDVEKIIVETLDEALKDVTYDEDKVPHWINHICETVMEKLNEPKKPFKYVVTCIIMQRNGAGIHSATSCYWDAVNDGALMYCWPKEKSKDMVKGSMYCFVTVFCLEF
eukprot:NODE_28175_length_486_cov_8.175487.p2 GENE.NODE_28175_length_486_cov_8.175487~~NODE_28175_length_486_cov_8.175487.p2  ORF type:complete len:118 (+),score=31.28 NODE_28175_length_486_cov_8.175487:29-382(+)